MLEVIKFHTEPEVKKVVDELYTEGYFADVVAPNKEFLEGKASKAVEVVETRLRNILKLIDTNANAVMEAAGFSGGLAIFSLHAATSYDNPDETTKVTIGIRINLPGIGVIKMKEKYNFDETFYGNLLNHVHRYELALLDAIVTRDNVAVLNAVMNTIEAEKEASQAAFSISFAQSEAPIVSITPDSLVLGVDAFNAVNTVPVSGFADVLTLTNKEEAEAAENARKLEELTRNTENPEDENDEVEQEIAQAAPEEAPTSEELLAHFLPAETEEESEVDPLTLLTPEERREKERESYEDLVLKQKVEVFKARLYDTWLSSMNPLEFIKSYSSEVFPIVAGNVTKARCKKVTPILKESFRLTEKSLGIRKTGGSLILEGEGAEQTARILIKENDEIIETYPAFNVKTLV